MKWIGYNLFTWLHRKKKPAAVLMKIRADIPVILCTRFSERITEERVRELGIREFILKPGFEEQAG